jgi:3-phenylpropionate/cinnamic acid dioxygenase small subunit
MALHPRLGHACPVTDDERRAALQDIAEVLVRYASGIDRRDWDLFRTCFTEDLQADYGEMGGTFASADEITAFMERSHREVGHTMHQLSNLDIRVDGRTATARSYVEGILVAADGRTGLNPVGFYDDELVRTTEGWRIARRRFTPVLMRTIG